MLDVKQSEVDEFEDPTLRKISQGPYVAVIPGATAAGHGRSARKENVAVVTGPSGLSPAYPAVGQMDDEMNSSRRLRASIRSVNSTSSLQQRARGQGPIAGARVGMGVDVASRIGTENESTTGQNLGKGSPGQRMAEDFIFKRRGWRGEGESPLSVAGSDAGSRGGWSAREGSTIRTVGAAVGGSSPGGAFL